MRETVERVVDTTYFDDLPSRVRIDLVARASTVVPGLATADPDRRLWQVRTVSTTADTGTIVVRVGPQRGADPRRRGEIVVLLHGEGPATRLDRLTSDMTVTKDGDATVAVLDVEFSELVVDRWTAAAMAVSLDGNDTRFTCHTDRGLGHVLVHTLFDGAECYIRNRP